MALTMPFCPLCGQFEMNCKCAQTEKPRTVDIHNRVNHSTKCKIRDLPPGVLASETTCDCGVAGPIRNERVCNICKTAKCVTIHNFCSVCMDYDCVHVQPKNANGPENEGKRNPIPYPAKYGTVSALDALKCHECGKYPTCVCKPCPVKSCYRLNCNDPRHTESIDMPPISRGSDSACNCLQCRYHLWEWYLTIAATALLFAGLYVIYACNVR
jgi:hypothetical protein